MTLDKTKSRSVEHQRHKYRRFFAQFLATTVKNLFAFNGGLCYALSTIVIASLTGTRNKHNQNEFLSISAVEATWLGALGFIFKLIGSLLSGIATDPLGRKRSMMVLCIPLFIGWCVLSRATNVWQVFVGISFHGLSVGLVEAPYIAYIGEICEPSYRGIMLSYSVISSAFGPLTIYILNTMLPWRKVCLVCSAGPVITAIAICFVVETPRWLLSKNRNDEAEKSLRWLRGWVSSEVVAQEFNDLKQHSELTKSCSMAEKLAELKRKRTLKPLAIVISLFFLANFTTLTSARAFLTQIFKAYNNSMPADQAVTVMSILEFAGTVSLLVLIRFTGKRRLFLFGISMLLALNIVVTWYGFTYLPHGHSSFDQTKSEYQLENKALGYIPTVCLILSGYFSYMCIVNTPWVLLSEIFPFKCRGIASGIATAFYFVFAIINSKSYYTIETTLSLPGIGMLYTCVCFIGLILMYNILPETEGRSLEDIELHFSDNSKGITNRKIAISKQPNAENGNEHEMKTLI